MSTQFDPVAPPLAEAWRGLVDDAAIFPPGDAPLAEAAAAHVVRRSEPYADLVGSFVLRDTDLPALDTSDLAVSLVVTGGAGQVAGPAALCRRRGLALAGIEIALRDPDDLPGNARRVAAAVEAARADEALEADVQVFVELPAGDPTAGWLAAADVVAEQQMLLKFRTGGLDASAYPTAATLATWIDAALDRETPFKATAGLHHAVRHTGDDGFEHHGFLNLLAATRLAFDGAAAAEVTATLEQRDGATLADLARGLDLPGARRWFRSFGSCDVADPLADLTALDLLEKA